MFQQNDLEKLPQTSELKSIPLWIKVMWACGVVWVVSYIAYNLTFGLPWIE